MTESIRYNFGVEQLAPCIPPFWASGGHLQTLLGYLIPSPSMPERGERLDLPLPDGDRLIGYLYTGTSDVVVYLFHGLGGNVDANYVQRTTLLCQKLGHTAVLFNHRGCGEGAGLARQPYHSGRAEDLSEAIAYGRKRFPKHRHVAIGFSLGGNALLLLLSGRRGPNAQVQPDCAIAVNAPIDLQRAAHALKVGFNRVYDLNFVRECRADIRKRDPHARYEFPLLGTLHDFDAIYTAPAGGFESREHYYESCSTKGLLSEIRVPTVLITAKDDPFVDYRDYVEARRPPCVHLHLEEFGGHIGYLSGSKTPLGTRRWIDYALAVYLQRLLR